MMAAFLSSADTSAGRLPDLAKRDRQSFSTLGYAIKTNPVTPDHSGYLLAAMF
jgi:hypothetical protein